MWGGRFSGKTDELMDKFNRSFPYDKRMWAQDIQGSKAYAKGLSQCGLLSAQESTDLIRGLESIEFDTLDPNAEDIHTANEQKLTQLIGPLAGKLHTGRYLEN